MHKTIIHLVNRAYSDFNVSPYWRFIYGWLGPGSSSTWFLFAVNCISHILYGRQDLIFSFPNIVPEGIFQGLEKLFELIEGKVSVCGVCIVKHLGSLRMNNELHWWHYLYRCSSRVSWASHTLSRESVCYRCQCQILWTAWQEGSSRPYDFIV